MDIMLQRILELTEESHGQGSRLAEHLGISPNRISDWKAGRVKSYTKYASQIADFYNVSLDWLSGKTDDKSKKPATQKDDELSEAEIEIIKLYRAASEERKAIVRGIVGIE